MPGHVPEFSLLFEMGTDVNPSVCQKTHFVFAGERSDLLQIKKIEELRSNVNPLKVSGEGQIRSIVRDLRVNLQA